MKLNFWERLLVNNPVRSFVQRHYEAPLLLRKAGRLDGKRVLEIGCGRGVGLEVILQRFGAGHVTGIDLDSSMVETARNRLASYPPGKLTIETGDAAAIPSADGTFDAVFDFGIVHHIPKWQKAVSEVSRVLKPGGLFLFEEVTRRGLDRWLYRTFLEHPSENRFSMDEFLTQLDRDGLEPEGRPTTLSAGDIFIGVARKRR